MALMQNCTTEPQGSLSGELESKEHESCSMSKELILLRQTYSNKVCNMKSLKSKVLKLKHSTIQLKCAYKNYIAINEQLQKFLDEPAKGANKCEEKFMKYD